MARSFFLLLLLVGLSQQQLGVLSWEVYSLANPTGIITFDNLGLTIPTSGMETLRSNIPVLNPAESSLLNITLNETKCALVYNLEPNLPALWNSDQAWGSSEPSKIGYFASNYGFPSTMCIIWFREPVHAFVMKINAEDNFVVTTHLDLPYAFSNPLQGNASSTYTTFGFSYDRLISGFSVTSDKIFRFDDIQWLKCNKNERFNVDGCEDLCVSSGCDLNSSCDSSNGTAVCTCNEGYEGDGKSCTDIDECSAATPCDSVANARCNNTQGSFTCICQDGYEGDGVICKDIDECSLSPSPCSSQAQCNNTEGSFSCECIEGYEGSGYGADGCQEVLVPGTSTPAVSIDEPVSQTIGVSEGCSLTGSISVMLALVLVWL